MPPEPFLTPADRGPQAPPLWRVVFTTVVGNVFMIVGSFSLAVIACLVSPIPPRTTWTFGIARLWSLALLKACSVRLRVLYDPALDLDASYVFLSNHQSLFDIPAVMATSPSRVRLVAKRSLFYLPVFGWAMKLGGFIPVDRSDRSTALQTFASASALLANGTSVVLFPEGTRSLDNTLLPFERGGFLMALKSGLPIVPVGVRGSRAVRSRDGWGIRPGTIEVRYGAPLSVADYGVRRKRELIAEVRRQIAELADLEAGDAAEARAVTPGGEGARAGEP